MRIGRGRALYPSITQERSVSGVWGFLSCFTTTTWTSHPRAAPFHSEVSLAWATIAGLWIEGAGRPPSWVGTRLLFIMRIDCMSLVSNLASALLSSHLVSHRSLSGSNCQLLNWVSSLTSVFLLAPNEKCDSNFL